MESYKVDGDMILVIYVPRAKRDQKPVYINNDLFGGTYRRDWEGDYHCSKAEIKAMLRDAAEETEDMKIVEQFDVSVMILSLSVDSGIIIESIGRSMFSIIYLMKSI